MSEHNHFPWYLIVWHCIWIIPLMTVRVIFCVLIAVNNFSLGDGVKAWHVTE